MARTFSQRFRHVTLIRTAVSVVFFAACGVAYLAKVHLSHDETLSKGIHHRDGPSGTRRLLFHSDLFTDGDVNDDKAFFDQLPGHNDSENCTKRGISNFPNGLFTNDQRKNGALVVNFLAAAYLCGVIGYVCSTYFVPSLEIMCERLNLQTDVAGATFMAAGSSAPELFASVIGLFISHDETGFSAVVGSAAFNIFIIISLCCFFAGHILYLNWWPFLRDCVFYTVSIIIMAIFIYDKKIEWWEGLILTLGYVAYIVTMYFNPYLSQRADELTEYWRSRRNENQTPPPDAVGLLTDTDEQVGQTYGSVAKDPALQQTDTHMANGSPHIGHTSNGLLSNGVIPEYLSDAEKQTERPQSPAVKNRSRTNTNMSLSCSLPPDHEPLSERQGSVFSPPASLGFRIMWIIGLPCVVLMFLTIPDCRKSGLWRRLYMVSFVMSCIWLAGTSYILYWMIVVIGYTLNIPDTVMGITFLAGGTSVPDAIASVLVARDGYGDMALSNIIGSNIFEVFVCLGMLWFIYGLAFGEPLEIQSQAITFTTISLIIIVIFIVLVIHFNGWKLDLKVGVMCIVVYLAFITFAIVWELGLIGHVELPNYCPGPT